MFSIFYVFINNADENHGMTQIHILSVHLHCVSHREGAECAELCNYFVQNLVKVLVC